MTIRNINLSLEDHYLQSEANRLGVTRTKLARAVMQKIIRDELIPQILNDDDPVLNEPTAPKYRRFPERHSD
jgi:hypothetical protein